ncbi:3'-5' exonuclease [Clostridium grantii]|uniref:UvrD-like helicase C-terminal domain-containing protein n=1 Tax=Clostridium grantii DSM 8605 TaxID=1121316 RepID=A0A1M5Y1S7_9CLOT|nr:3'-5' exonuclease [Clostridium grantii]SHI06035.1 UvrD-like helicase C-terminal domain-containing protein [Clostridium grantii DSM 8605]
MVFTDVYNVKGLEFDYVFLLQFDKFHYSNKKEKEKLDKYNDGGDISKDLEDIDNDERKRLYVAMTRAKTNLEMMYFHSRETAVSPFFYDFDAKDYVRK